MTPGIRPAGAARGDQKRIMTPAAAIAAGADYLVVGRPITEAADPKAAADAIVAEIAAAAHIKKETTMAKGYWIATCRCDATLTATRPMQAANAEPFRKFGAKFLVRGGNIRSHGRQLRARAMS